MRLPGLRGKGAGDCCTDYSERTLIPRRQRRGVRAREQVVRVNHDKNRHAKVKGAHLRFRFRGKSGRHEVDVTDLRIAKIVSKCQDLPGQDLLIRGGRWPSPGCDIPECE